MRKIKAPCNEKLNIDVLLLKKAYFMPIATKTQ
jgi:hypothetical protein